MTQWLVNVHKGTKRSQTPQHTYCGGRDQEALHAKHSFRNTKQCISGAIEIEFPEGLNKKCSPLLRTTCPCSFHLCVRKSSVGSHWSSLLNFNFLSFRTLVLFFSLLFFVFLVCFFFSTQFYKIQNNIQWSCLWHQCFILRHTPTIMEHAVVQYGAIPCACDKTLVSPSSDLSWSLVQARARWATIHQKYCHYWCFSFCFYFFFTLNKKLRVLLPNAFNLSAFSCVVEHTVGWLYSRPDCQEPKCWM